VEGLGVGRSKGETILLLGDIEGRNVAVDTSVEKMEPPVDGGSVGYSSVVGTKDDISLGLRDGSGLGTRLGVSVGMAVVGVEEGR
jgi:hypothetical protein